MSDVQKNWNRWIDDHCQEFICSCCNQTRYRHQVKEVTPALREIVARRELPKDSLRGVHSVDTRKWISLTSVKHLTKSKTPPPPIVPAMY